MEERTRSTTTLLILGALLSTVSCAVPAFEVGSDKTPISGAGGAGVGGQDGDPPSDCADFDWQDATCASCVEASCCNPAHVCRADESCATLYDCQAQCGEGDTECRAACAVTEHEAFKTAEQTLSWCLSANCRDTCVPCGGMVHGYMPTCTTCVEANCCAEASACADDPGCAAMSKCNGDNLAPLNACGSGADLGAKGKRDALRTCFATHCADACYGENWTCDIGLVSTLAWPEVRFATVKVMAVNPTVPGCLDMAGKFTPGLGTSSSPVPPECLYPGSLVKACFKNDPACAEPYAMDTTQVDGVATLTNIPLADGGIFEGFFELTGGGAWSSVAHRQHDVKLTTHFHTGALPIAVNPSNLDLAADTGITIESGAGKGHIYLAIRDCTHALAPGIRFEIVDLPEWEGYYVADGEPVEVLDETVDGHAVLLNIPVGTREVRAIHVATGDVVSTQVVQVREDWLTNVALGPSP